MNERLLSVLIFSAVLIMWFLFLFLFLRHSEVLTFAIVPHLGQINIRGRHIFRLDAIFQ